LILDALSIANIDFELRILGEGPLTRKMMKRARKLQIENRCDFLGMLSHDEALEQLGWCDLFVFTSLRDSMPTVLLESLSYGVPILCIDHQGVSDVVDDDCAFRIPLSGYGKTVRDISDSLRAISADKKGLLKKSKSARTRAMLFTWRAQAAQIIRCYDRVCSERVEPDGKTDVGGNLVT